VDPAGGRPARLDPVGSEVERDAASYTRPMRLAAALAERTRKRPITAFLVLTFALSYPLGILFNFWVSSIVPPGTLTSAYLPRLLTVIGPAAAALVVAACGAGNIRVRSLIEACRFSPRQLPSLVGIVLVALAITGIAYVLSGMSAARVIRVAADHPSILLAHLAAQSMIVGFGEEIGWRGWLLPSVAEQRSFGAATAITGAVWGSWHGPVFLSNGKAAFSFALLLASLAVILAWLWRRSRGSIAVVATMHGAANGPFTFLESYLRPEAGGPELVGNAFMYLAVLYAGFAMIVGVWDRHIWSASVTNGYS